MEGKIILLSGSASPSCSVQRLDLAIGFVQHFVTEVLKAGGGMVVLASSEQRDQALGGRPRLFDWTVLRTIEDYVSITSEPSKTRAHVVMSDDAWQSKLDADNRGTLTRLQQRKVLEIKRVPREEYTGGLYRQLQCELADGMIALGGGKGTYTAGRQMIRNCKPVLPVDLDIGAMAADGVGARLLHKEMLKEPSEFFPHSHRQIATQFESLSLDCGIYEVGDVARKATEALALELTMTGSNEGSGAKHLARRVWRAAGSLLSAIGVLRALDWIRQLPF